MLYLLVFTEDSLKTKVDIDDFKGTKLGELYLTPAGDFVKEGTLIKNEELAKTLDIIAKEGSEAFYEGELTKSIIEAVCIYDSMNM